MTAPGQHVGGRTSPQFKRFGVKKPAARRQLKPIFG